MTDGEYAMSAYDLNRVLYDVGRLPDPLSAVTDKDRLLAGYRLTAAERRALAEPNFAALRELGALTNLVFRYYRYHGLDVTEFARRLRSEQLRRTTRARR